MKKVFEIIDEIKDEHKKIAEAWDEKKEISQSLMIGWIDKNVKLMLELGKKIEELQERLDTLQAEGKKKGLFG
ncbi:MAG: hypothetical protein ACE5J7_00995 [Candidatus Aenigmatarchaeota archaeon]